MMIARLHGQKTLQVALRRGASTCGVHKTWWQKVAEAPAAGQCCHRGHEGAQGNASRRRAPTHTLAHYDNSLTTRRRRRSGVISDIRPPHARATAAHRVTSPPGTFAVLFATLPLDRRRGGTQQQQRAALTKGGGARRADCVAQPPRGRRAHRGAQGVLHQLFFCCRRCCCGSAVCVCVCVCVSPALSLLSLATRRRNWASRAQ